MWPFTSNKGDVLHHWHALTEDFQTSCQGFYAAIEKALSDRQIPGLTVARVELGEGGLLSAKREYLRLTRERLVFDICAAPFGTGYFFSSRYIELPILIHPLEVLVLLGTLFFVFALFIHLFGFFFGIFLLFLLLVFGVSLMVNAVALGLNDVDASLLKTPVIGRIYERFFRKETYHREDTRFMYLQTVPAIVKQIAEDITAAHGVKFLKQYERSPILGDLYKAVPRSEPQK